MKEDETIVMAMKAWEYPNTLLNPVAQELTTNAYLWKTKQALYFKNTHRW